MTAHDCHVVALKQHLEQVSCLHIMAIWIQQLPIYLSFTHKIFKSCLPIWQLLLELRYLLQKLKLEVTLRF